MSARNFKIIVRGRGGHGAYPHTTIDPIVLSAQIVLALQSFLPRKINATYQPIEITRIDGGTKRNIIPPSTTITGHYTIEKAGKIILTKRAMAKIIKDIGRSAGLTNDELPQILDSDALPTARGQSPSLESASRVSHDTKTPYSPNGQQFDTPLLRCANKRLQEAICNNTKSIAQIYKKIHQNPELSFQEEQTAKLVARELSKLPCQVFEKIGGFGVVGVMKNGPGKTVMVRADMDGLPIEEQTGAPYASKKIGTNEKGERVHIMHACGHDVHTSCLIGTARVMNDLRDQWSGTLMFVGQPAEERGRGAKAMIKDGLFERFPRPDYCIAQHCDASLPAGKVGYCKGYYNATLSSADITLHGPSSPLASANVILALQKIASRRLEPTVPSVVTVGRISTSQSRDITLELTIRARTSDTWQKVIEALQEIATNVSSAALIPGEKKATLWIGPQGAPATINSSSLVDRALPIWRDIYGSKNLVTGTPSMGGDDFGYYGHVSPPIPLFYWRLGVSSPPRDRVKQGALHSPFFLPQIPEALKSGMMAMSSLLLDLLAKEHKNH